MQLPPILSSEPAWRCLRSKPKCEHLAARHLRLAGFDAYCPQLRYQKKTVRGAVWYVEALFPSYVFARFAADSNRHVKSTLYVSGLLEFLPEWGRLPDHVVEDLQRQFADDVPHTVQLAPAIGDPVQMTEGPLMGTEAIVTKISSGAQRIQILIDFLGSPRHMEVPLSSLLGFGDARSIAVERIK